MDRRRDVEMGNSTPETSRRSHLARARHMDEPLNLWINNLETCITPSCSANYLSSKMNSER
jgi:hypothetical protein